MPGRPATVESRTERLTEAAYALAEAVTEDDYLRAVARLTKAAERFARMPGRGRRVPAEKAEGEGL